MKFDKTTYPVTYLWLWAGLLLFRVETQAQDVTVHSYKELGWVASNIAVNVPRQNFTNGKFITPLTADLMLRDDHKAIAAIEAFAAKYPGRETVDFTAELLELFDQTKEKTEGFQLFFSLENARFQPVIVHTKINRNNVAVYPNGGADTKNYRADFTHAYFWNNDTRRWILVEDTFTYSKTPAGKPVKVYSLNLRKRIRTGRNQFDPNMQGYYLSKDALVAAWKSTGQQPLTMFFQYGTTTSAKPTVHLRLPYFPRKLAASILLPTVDRTGKPVSTISMKLPVLHTNGPSRYFRTYTSHLPIRSCKPYCGEDAEI